MKKLVYIYRLVPESPRWLIAQGLYSKAEKVVKKIACINNIQLPDDISKVLAEQQVWHHGHYLDIDHRTKSPKMTS